MARSIHDNLLISYEVQCEARAITLRTEYRVPEKPTEYTKVIFEGVQGYRFENDAFGNIIFGLEAVPVEHLLTEFRAAISDSYRLSGAPGAWAADLGLAPEYLRQHGIKGFILSSSCGLSGWVLASKMSVFNAEARVPTDGSLAKIL